MPNNFTHYQGQKLKLYIIIDFQSKITICKHRGVKFHGDLSNMYTN